MFKKLAPLAVAALVLIGSETPAEAAFSVATMFNGGATTVTPAGGITFTTNSLMVTSSPTIPISFNFINIVYTDQVQNIDTTFTLNGTFTAVNGNVTAMGSFSETFRYLVDANGNGSLSLVSSSLPTSVAGLSFGPNQFSAPSVTPLSAGTSNRGNVSTTVQQTAGALPEPASLAMVGLGLAGVGGLALRRRRTA